MWHIIGECLERSRSMEGWERWFTRSRCEVQENVFERTEEDVFSREANNTYGYMGEGNYASNIKKQGKSHTSGLTKPNMEGSKRELAASLGEAWLKNGFTVLARPNWTDGAVLYSAFPQGSVNSRGAEIGGLEPFRKYILPRLSMLGINICWLNPFNEGGYAVHSYYQFQKGVGVEQDLVNLARDAHSRKINILMDLIPHGPKPGKPYAEKILKEHPEWISRKSDGSPKLWWGGYAMDYASPGWQKAMADLASYYINKADIDGWRVDCARYSPDNECPTDGRIPSQSGTEGALKLMKTVHESINAHKPETILLGECHTLTHLSSMEFIYDSALGYNVIPSLQGQLPEEWVPKLKQYMDRNTSAIPQEMFRGLMHFSENHDMLKSLYRLGAGHTRALFSLNFLIPGIPLVNYDQDNGFGLHLKKLAALRKRPEFINGEALYKQTETDAPTVFTFTRQLPEQFSAVAINFSGTEKDVTMTCPEKSIKAVKKNSLIGKELYDNAPFLIQGNKLSFKIPPYGTRVFAFSQEFENASSAITTTPTTVTTPTATNSKTIRVSESGDSILVETPYSHAEFRNGFPVSLKDRFGREFLSPIPWINQAKFEKWNIEKKPERIILQGRGIFGKNSTPWEISYETRNGSEWKIRLKTSHDSKLFLELPLADDLDEWYAGCLEGPLHDFPAITHPAGDQFELQETNRWPNPTWELMMQSKSGILLQSSIMPLDPEYGQLTFRGGNTWMGLRFAPEDHIELFLRERSKWNSGLTLRIASRDGKPLNCGWDIRLDDPPVFRTRPMTGSGWSLNIDSTAHRFCNTAYALTLRRNLGGNFYQMTDASGKEVLIKKTELAGNNGFFLSQRDTESGKILERLCTNTLNCETAMKQFREKNRIHYNFSGKVKSPAHYSRYDARTQVAYSIDYLMDETNKLRQNVKLDILPDAKREGSLFYDYTLPEPKTVRFDNKIFFPKKGAFLTVPADKLGPGKCLTFHMKNGTQWSFSIPQSKGIVGIRLEGAPNGNTILSVRIMDQVKGTSHSQAVFSIELEIL